MEIDVSCGGMAKNDITPDDVSLIWSTQWVNPNKYSNKK